MVLKRKRACRIVQCATEFRKCQELEDFTVTIGNVQFKCHRMILASCSEFFRKLFGYGMKETEQRCVDIKEISSKTFKLILEAIYTEKEILTNDNVIDIWRAAHQLQTHFLVSECESFISKNVSLDNYIEYLNTSKMLISDIVLTPVWSFVLKNCDTFFQTRCFLELPLADVTALIKSQDLGTKSEDDVIDAILKWAEFQDNRSHFSGVTSDGILNRDTLERIKDNESDSDGEPSRKKSRKCKDISTLIGSLDINAPTDSSNDRRNQTDVTNDSDGEPSRKKSRKCQDISTLIGSLNINAPTDSRNDRRNQTDVTNENIRRNNFTMLLSHARIFLASHRYLEFLINHPLVRENKEAKNIVNDALMYQLRKENGHWPSRAIHIVNGDFIHCIVGAHRDGSDVHFNAYTLTSKKYFELPSFIYVTNIKIAAAYTKMYSLYTRPYHPNLRSGNKPNNAVNQSTLSPLKRLYLFELLTNSWSKVNIYLNVSSDDFNVALVDSFLYIFSAEDQKVWKLDPATRKHTKVSDLPVQDAISYVIPHYQWILVFYTSTAVGVEETVVQCYDTSNNTWNKPNKIEGSANGMTSFKDDNFTYLLQSNGNIWKVVKSKSKFIDFEFVVKLWNCIWPLHAAFVFLGELYICVKPKNPQIDPQLMRSLPGVFKEIIYYDMTSFGNSAVTPFIFSRNDYNIHLLPGMLKSRFIKQM